MSDKPINSLPPTIKSTQQKSTSDVSTQGLKTMTPVKPTISSNLVEPNRLVSSTVGKGKIVEPSNAPTTLVSNKQPKGVLVNESLLTPNKVVNQEQKDTSSVKLPNIVNSTKAPQLNKCRTTLSNMNGDTIGNGQEVITTCNGCIVVRTDKNVYVNVTENTIEQNYIKNNGGLGTTLCVGTVNTGNTYTNVVSNVQKLAFDDDSGFAVCDLGSGIAKVAMNSTFKCWEVNGSSGLIACGLDTVNFVAGSGVTITSNNSAVPKSLTISASGGGGGTPGGCNTQIQFNNSGTFAGACGLTYDSTTCSVGITKITVPKDQNLQISVSSSNSAWWSLYGDPFTIFGTVEQYSSGVVYDLNGNSYIIGANGDDGIPFLVKYDTNGYILWKKDFTESNNYYKTGDAVATDSLGNVYCAVGTDDSINDVTIFKISSSGNIIWQTMLTGTAFNPYIACTDLAVDASGNVFASLYYDNTPDESQTLIKLNSSGVIQWQKVVSGDSNGYSQGLTVDGSGNIIMNGQYATPTASSNVLLTKFDSNGNLLWQKGFANPFDNTYVTQPGQVVTDSSNNIIITGRYQTIDNYVNGFVIKLDSSGNLLWQRNFPGAPGSPGYDLYGASMDASDNIYIAGYGGLTYSGNQRYLYVFKFDSSGAVQWQRKFGSGNEFSYWYWSARMIDVINSSYIINGYSYATGGNADAITAQFPTDGSLTGNYGYFTYEDITIVSNTTTFTLSTTTMSVTNGILTIGPGIYTLSNASGVDYLYSILGGNNTFNIKADGTFELSNYSLPYISGQNKQVLTSCGNGQTNWTDPNIYLSNDCCSLRISSPSDQLNVVGCNNFAVGFGALACTTTNWVYNNGNTAIGWNALHYSDGSINNFAVGSYAMYCASNNSHNNAAIGYGALRNATCNIGNNFAFGPYALHCLTANSNNNTAIGENALRNTTGGFSNIAIGYGSQSDTNGSAMNIGIGYDTLKNICNSTDNVALGAASQRCLVTGSHNISLGFETLKNHVCGGGNIAIGYISQRENICGNDNVGVGACSLLNNTTGNFNVAVGHSTLANNQNGGNNVAIGYRALEFNNTGNSTVAVGPYAAFLNKSGGITAIGDSTLSNNTTGVCNTAIGAFALNSNIVGVNNTAIGNGAAMCNLGSCNVAIGTNAIKWGANFSNVVAIGNQVMENNTCGYGIVAIGEGAGRCGGLTYGSVAVGYKAGANLVDNSPYNSLFGISAGRYTCCSVFNTFIGACAGYCLKGGPSTSMCNVFNTAIGSYGMTWGCNMANNVAIGDYAMYGDFACSNPAGVRQNVAIGSWALNRTRGSCNTAIGAEASSSNRFGNNNVAVGTCSLLCNTDGCNNIGVGLAAGCSIATGSNNTIIGTLPGTAGLVCTVLIGAGTCERIKVDNNGLCINGTLIGGASPATPTTLGTVYASTTISTTCNVFIGYCAGNTGMTGYGNIALGFQALANNTTGINNIAIGSYGLTNTVSYGNIGIGNSTLLCNSTGYNNLAMMRSALQRNTTGSYNIAIGDNSLTRNTTGCDNLAIGSGALSLNTFGSRNIALGLSASSNNISGNNNVAVGWLALRCNLTSDNVAIGYCSGFSISTGTRNITFGSCSGCSVSTGSNNTIIGSLAGTAGLVCTVLIGAGTCERIKVDNNGLCINGSLFTGGGVSSLNTLTGAVTLSGGTNVTIGSSGNTLTICSSGGGGGITSLATSGSGLGFSLSGGPITTTGTVSLTVPTVTDLSTCLQGDGLCNTSVGFRILPQNSQSADYTLVAADSGKHLLHPSADANARTFTIPANSSVAYPIGTSITFVNETSQVLTISITSDTMYLAGSGLTGSRTLSQYGVATAIKTGTTTWYISGTGLT